MRETTTIQFRFPWKVVEAILPGQMAAALRPLAQERGRYCQVEVKGRLDGEEFLVDPPLLLEGRSVVRILRRSLEADLPDLVDPHLFELRVDPHRDLEVALVGDPGRYYDLRLECAACGRWTWHQCKNLRVRRTFEGPCAVTNNGEYLISAEAADVLRSGGIGGCELRAVDGPVAGARQLVFNATVPVLRSRHLVELDACATCGQPRTRRLEASNGVDLLRGPENRPRVEEEPTMCVGPLPVGLALTDLEFGTIGLTPAGAGGADRPAFRTSWPRIVASARAARNVLAACGPAAALVPLRANTP